MYGDGSYRIIKAYSFLLFARCSIFQSSSSFVACFFTSVLSRYNLFLLFKYILSIVRSVADLLTLKVM